MKMSRGHFDLFFFFFFFFLSLFETTEICLGSTRMDNSYREKTCHAWKSDFAPSGNIPLTPLLGNITTTCATSIVTVLWLYGHGQCFPGWADDQNYGDKN